MNSVMVYSSRPWLMRRPFAARLRSRRSAVKVSYYSVGSSVRMSTYLTTLDRSRTRHSDSQSLAYHFLLASISGTPQAQSRYGCRLSPRARKIRKQCQMVSHRVRVCSLTSCHTILLVVSQGVSRFLPRTVTAVFSSHFCSAERF